MGERIGECRRLYPKSFSYQPSFHAKTRILLCDDQSTGGTAEEVLRMQSFYLEKDIRLEHGPGVCKSRNVCTGFSVAITTSVNCPRGDDSPRPAPFKLQDPTSKSIGSRRRACGFQFACASRPHLSRSAWPAARRSFSEWGIMDWRSSLREMCGRVKRRPRAAFIFRRRDFAIARA